MRFKLIFLSLGLVLLFIASIFDVNYLNYESPIAYTGVGEISFYDFKGLKKPFTTLDGMSEFAFIETSREIDFHGPGEVAITTYFHPSRSYVFAKDIRNPDLLRHELYHFHIAEYCSRLFRQEISLVNAIGHEMITKLSDKYELVEDELQKQYDEDSYHGYVLQQQKKWEKDIDQNLLSLNKYADPIVRIMGQP
ncbi:MAG: hypothetical protein ABI480_03290 [Chitinophagaceae bacterium]